MKKLITISMAIFLLFSAFSTQIPVAKAATDTQFSKTAVDFVKDITVGWNLGNTMESYPVWYKSSQPGNFTVNQVETGCSNPTTSQEMFDKIASSGFNAVRIPVTWYLFIDDNNNYTINNDYMNRIKEIVGYAQKNNMYVILNTHHDDKRWINIDATGTEWENIKTKFKRVWQQIAIEFSSYDEKIIFEATNETLSGGYGTSEDWWGTDADFEKLNELYQVFYDTVRSSGGNNSKRYLMYSTYAAQWYSHQYKAVKIPNNDKHSIIDIHWYATTKTESAAEQYMKPIYTDLVANGTVVVFGECGPTAAYDSDKKLWAQCFIGVAKKYGMPCFYWDDGGSYKLLDRKTLTYTSQVMVDAMIDTAKNTQQPASTLMYGDVNGDNSVDCKDVLAIRKYLSNESINIDTTAADVNLDLDVTSVDVIKLRAWLAGKKVVLGSK